MKLSSIFTRIMKAHSSKRRDGNGDPPHFQMNANSDFAQDFSSYAAACKLDPGLRSFDSTIRKKTSRVISSLAIGVEVRSLSLEALQEFANCLLEMNQEVARVILDCKEDILNNKDLFSLVQGYFTISVNTLDFCTSLENCLESVRNNCSIIRTELNQLDVRACIQNGCFENILGELRKLKEVSDPFTEEFFSHFQAAYQQPTAILEKLLTRKRKLEKKMKSTKSWRMVSNVLFVAAFVSVLIFSVVAAAISAPPIVAALAGALAVPIGSVGKWCHSLWNGLLKALKGQRDLVTSIQVGIYVTIKDVDDIRVLVNKLEVEMDDVVHKSEFPCMEEDSAGVTAVINEIKGTLDVFGETIDKLWEQIHACSRSVRQARTVTLQRIIKYPNGQLAT